jgi:hypothetical protein
VAIALLLVVWTFWPSSVRRPPVLLIVRNRSDEVEGVVRTLRAAGHEVTTLDRGSSDETGEILRRLVRDGCATRVMYGDIDRAVAEAREPALLLIRLDEQFTAHEALRAARFGR